MAERQDPACGGRRFRIVAVLAGLLISGCASLGPTMEAPRISLVSMRSLPVESGDLETVFQIDLRLINPNDVPLKIRGIDCQLDVNRSTLAAGVSDQEVTLPRLGTAVVPVTVYASMSDFVWALFRMLSTHSGRAESFDLNYTLHGRVFLAEGLPGLNRLTFETQGDLSQILPPPKPSP